jgi:dihydroflavonol-4-reductase
MDGQSVKRMSAMISRELPMLSDMGMGMVDGRDFSHLQVRAMAAVGAAGKRFIAVSAEPIETTTVAKVLKEAGYIKVSSRRVPNILLKFLGLFDAEVRGMLTFIAKAAAYEIQATFDVLAWQSTPLEASFRKMA